MPVNSSSNRLLVELDLRLPVSAASYVNSVPVVSRLNVQSLSEAAERRVQVVISGRPLSTDFALHIDELGPGESRTFDVVDLPLSHDYLAGCSEREYRDLTIVATSDAEELFRAIVPMEILAYDQWAGMRSLPELLAAFSQPNTPSIDGLLSAASRILEKARPGAAIRGYQTGSREDVWYQVAGIYSAIAAEHLVYSTPPASFGVDGQKIRLAERILSGRLGTCLDLTMLVTSCLEQASLHPVVLVKEGHSWVGCWLVDSILPTAVTDDGQSIRKRVRSGEMVVFETTGLTGAAPMDLSTAVRVGASHLDDDAAFLFGLDIRRARMENILPLPSRWVGSEPPPSSPVRVPEIEPAPEFPPLDDEASLGDGAAPSASDGRIAHWKGKLLDLTGTNRLLNFRISRTTIPLLVPDLDQLEDALAGGRGWKFRSLFEFLPDEDPRSVAIAIRRTGENPYDALARGVMENRELLSALPPQDLTTRLVNILRASRTSFEESGANTLFLSMGMLYWRDESKPKLMPAPIVLMPVTISRRTTRSGFEITRHDDDTVVNPTLVQLLRDRFQLNLKGLDPLPADKAGVDVGKILQIFRLAVGDLAGWEVRDEAFLSLLSYAKYLMWKDLEDRAEDVRKNRVVARLIDPDQGEAAVGAPDAFADRRDIDARHAPWDLLTPLDADSSQMNALSRAAAGYDLVLEGPPGTGKSQTITNLIAHFLGAGKRVLFVSAKMAALDVVSDRLSAVGLGPFCLELHSAKAKKTEVLDQFRQALTAAESYSEADWLDEGQRLQALRADLNAWVETLHRPHENGLTLRDAMGVIYRHADWDPARIGASRGDEQVTARELNDQREMVRSLAGVIADLEHPVASHPLVGMTYETATFAWEDELAATLSESGRILKRIKVAAAAVASAVGPGGLSDATESLEAFDTLCEVLTREQGVPSGILERLDDNPGERLHEWARHGSARSEAGRTLGEWFRAEVSVVQGEPLLAEWTAALARGGLTRWLVRRRIVAQLRPYAVKLPAGSSLDTALHALSQINHEDGHIAEFADEAARTLGSTVYRGTDTDWDAVNSMADWADQFREALWRWALTQTDGPLARHTCTRWTKARGHEKARPALEEYRQAWQEYHAFRVTLTRLTQGSEPQSLPDGFSALGQTLRRWGEARSEWHLWARFMELRHQMADAGLGPIITRLDERRVLPEDLEAYWDYSYQYGWFRAVMDGEAPLRNFSRTDRERKIAEFRALDRSFQDATARYLVATLASRVPRVQPGNPPGPQMRVLQHELNKKRAHWPVRKLIQAMPTLLTQLKPCLLMSPLSVSQYLDLDARFDVVIFDEASQIPVWDAVGVIARGAQVIVVGDPKQLPPTNFFDRQGSDDPVDEGPLEDLESILDECLASSLPTLRLEWHYRSRHESLIAFSNYRYYESHLVTFPSPVTTDHAVRLQPVDGVYDRGRTRTNPEEAAAVVEAVLGHFQAGAEAAPSLGVVTFNQNQQLLIEEMLDRKLRGMPEVEDRINQARERLFIKNLENVQGDERDIIYFSVTYGRDANGLMALNMGPLNQNGGERRLNVAITRARLGVVIFSTITADDIDLGRTRARGVADLKDYLHYAQHGRMAGAAEDASARRQAHPIEEGIRTRLEARGYVCQGRIGASGHRVDVGVVDPRDPAHFILGVESDGDSYLALPSARDRDRLHQSVLEGLGWELERVWSLDWMTHADREVERIHRRLQTILKPEAEVSRRARRGSEPILATRPDFLAGGGGQHASGEDVRGPDGSSDSGTPLTRIDVREFLKLRHLEVIDNGASGGAIWVLGGADLGSVLSPLGSWGVRFTFAPHGGRASRNRPAWWTRDV